MMDAVLIQGMDGSGCRISQPADLMEGSNEAQTPLFLVSDRRSIGGNWKISQVEG
jgi:hypothetical protein